MVDLFGGMRLRSLATVGLLLAVVLSIIVPQTGGLAAGEQRYVSVYVDGETYNVLTNADSVGGVLDQIDVSVGQHDIVEPGLDTPMSLASFQVNVYRARPVKIIDGENVVTTKSAYWNPRLIAEDAGINVFPEDTFVESSTDNYIRDDFVGDVITVDRAQPVRLKLDGHTLNVRSQATTVSELIEEQGIVLGKHDITHPAREAVVDNVDQVEIIRVGHEVATEESTIPYETRYVVDQSLPIGYTVEHQKGEDGRRVVSYEIERHNGEIVNKTETSNKVTREVKHHIVRIGSSSNGGIYCQTQGSNKEVNLANAALGRRLAEERGWTGDQWNALLELWACESSWEHQVSNYGGSGAYGIPQALPASKMSTHGADYLTNPETQIRWGLDYIANRYGDPVRALSFHHANNWY